MHPLSKKLNHFSSSNHVSHFVISALSDISEIPTISVIILATQLYLPPFYHFCNINQFTNFFIHYVVSDVFAIFSHPVHLHILAIIFILVFSANSVISANLSQIYVFSQFWNFSHSCSSNYACVFSNNWQIEILAYLYHTYFITMKVVTFKQLSKQHCFSGLFLLKLKHSLTSTLKI